jgi:tetratricopeptide (TPR) repeat protein
MTAPAWAAILVVAWAAPAWALGPLERNHPNVEAGTQRYQAGDFAGALEQFDAAAVERPQDARVQYDRGVSLHKLGRNEEAKEALRRAQELDREGALGGKIHYNLGNVAAAAGDPAGAVREYRAALKADPGDEQARHNLEVVLKQLPPRKPSGPDGGTPDAGARDAGAPDGGRPDGGADAGPPDGGTPDGGGDAGVDGGQGDAGAGDGGPGDGGQKGPPEHGDGGADGGQSSPDAGAQPEAAPMGQDGGAKASKAEAEQLLDALKTSEKNLQLWRFRQKSQKSTPHAKDW